MFDKVLATESLSFPLPSRAQLSAKSCSLWLLGGAEPVVGGARRLHSFHPPPPTLTPHPLTPTLSPQKSRPTSLPFAVKPCSVLEIYCILIKLPEWETDYQTTFVFYYVINLA